MNISICKYDPAVDAKPYYVSGEVPYTENMTALHALKEFSETVEHVNYDISCRGRICGRCAMMLDGIPTLVCTYKLENRDHTFEPLEGYPVYRDLIVDKHALDDQLSGIYNRIMIEPYTEENYSVNEKNGEPAKWDTLYEIEYCCRCGVCSTACPVHSKFPDLYVGPSAMIATAYRYLDPLDQGDRVMEAVSNGLYHCIMCGTCDIVCPQEDIKHVEAWQMLRDAAKARGIKPSYAE
jgi:succinate dehydrogenase/fumarate reductase iron-sulfur protein